MWKWFTVFWGVCGSVLSLPILQAAYAWIPVLLPSEIIFFIFFSTRFVQAPLIVRGRALQAGTDMGAFFIVDNLATWHRNATAACVWKRAEKRLVKAWPTSDIWTLEAMDTRPLPPPLDPVVNPTYEAWKIRKKRSLMIWEANDGQSGNGLGTGGKASWGPP